MKKNILLFLLLIAGVAFAQTQIVDDFETGPGHFNLSTSYSGSTSGIIGYVPTVDSLNAAHGNKFLTLYLIDDAASTNNWFIRLLSGGGAPANNVLLGAAGKVSYWLKTNKAYLKCGFIMDDLNASGTGQGTNEVSDSQAVNGDGQWHMYEWSLADSNKWFPFTANGNGRIQDPVSIDAIFFAALNDQANADTAKVFLDYVQFVLPTTPVEIASIDAVVEHNAVDLRWITASELNNRGFEVQRNDGSGFTTIAFVAGNGTTTKLNGYTYHDVLAKTGTYTYRLKQIDFDGSVKYSKAVEAVIYTLPGSFGLAQNYPNPFNPTTRIVFSIPQEGQVTLALYNLIGEKVLDVVNKVLPAGEHAASVNAASLASGTYIYKLTAGTQSVCRKMTVIK